MHPLSPLEIAQSFIGEWAKGPDHLRQSFTDWLAKDVLYENVGLTKATTREEAYAVIDTFAPGLDHISVDMLAIVQDGERVFTERVDYLRMKDGSTLATIRLMGIFVVREGRIAEWRDYFHMAPPSTEG